MKKELGFKKWFFIIVVAIFIFFPEVFLLQKGFLSGDHRLQHYPWFYFYWENIKHFRLPWWNPLNQCGFPLLAEGQVGAFYPLNFLFAFFLPLRGAYNYSILVHFFLGGVFFFLYCRKIHFENVPSLWGTFIFLFGSCQGGFFYNVTSQRVLIWVPLSLFFIHRLFEKRSWREALSLGVIFALEAVAGYQQYAIYAIGFAILYFFLLRYSQKDVSVSSNKPNTLVLFGSSLLFSFLLALPQWVPFLELSHFSSRRELTEAFAYIGSMNPLGPLTLFLPSWQGILGTELYVGILGIFFVFYAIWMRRSRMVNIHLALFFIFLLLAWGRFSPLYVGLVKLTHFYGFRIPVKFLFFSGFSLSVLSTAGMQRWLSESPEVTRAATKKVSAFFSGFLALLVFGVFAASFALRFWHRELIKFLQSFISKYIIGNPYHPHSPEVYFAKLDSFYEMVLRNVNPLNPWILVTFLFFVLSGVFLFFLSRNRRSFQSPIFWVLFFILYCDLYVYGYRNIRGDYETFSFVHRESQIVDFLKRDSALFRIYIFNPNKARELVPLVSNSNMLDGIEEIGIYSPFASSGYKKLLGNLASVDDSISGGEPEEKAVAAQLDLLRLLNVKYVLSTKKLDIPNLHEVLVENDFKLYEMNHPLSRFLYVREEDYGEGNIETLVRKAKPVLAESLHRDFTSLAFHLQMPKKGHLLISDLNYPGWRAWVDGKEANPLTFLNLFRRLELSRGQHQIRFVFQPPYRNLTYAVSLLALVVYLLVAGVRLYR